MNLSAIEYRLLVEQAPILIWRSRADGLCDYFNERWLEFTGRTFAEELGDGWVQGVHPDDVRECLRIYTEAFAERRTFEMEYRLRRADGVFRWIFDRGGPYYDASGRFAGYIGSCIDVTEAVEGREQLRAIREAELRTLRGMLPLCAWCRKVKDDSGYWHTVEVYISQHAALDFSHGLCPACEIRLRQSVEDPGTEGNTPETPR
jgi:PAS domain S-box-containing protein